MSNPAVNWAFKVSGIRSSEKFLLVCLANYADENGICFPSQKSMSDDTALDRKTVISGLRRLVEARLIRDTGDRRGATRQVTVYQLCQKQPSFQSQIVPESEPLKSDEVDHERPTSTVDTVPVSALLCSNGKNGTVPFFPSNSPVFPSKGSRFSLERVPKTGHGTTNNHQGTTREPPVLDLVLPQHDRFREAVAIWNELLGGTLPKVEALSDDRRRKFGRAFQNQFGNDMEQWRRFCLRVLASDLLTGKVGRGWKASFDWVMAPNEMIRILEGVRDNVPPPTAVTELPMRGGGMMGAAMRVFEALDPKEKQRG